MIFLNSKEAVRTNLAFDLYGHCVRELECVEECVGDDRGPRVRGAHLHKLGDHLGPEDAPVLVTQLDRTVLGVGGLARFHAHVELAWKKRKKEEKKMFDHFILWHF